jgi:hypothetical protein
MRLQNLSKLCGRNPVGQSEKLAQIKSNQGSHILLRFINNKTTCQSRSLEFKTRGFVYGTRGAVL